MRANARALLLVTLLAPAAAAQALVENPAPAVLPTVPPSVNVLLPELRLVAPFEALPAGARITVLVGVANQGPGNVTDVVVSFRPVVGSGLTVIGFDGSRRVEDLDENETTLVSLIVATPPRQGVVRLVGIVDFLDEHGVARRVEKEVDLHIRPPLTDPLVVEYDAHGLVAGSETVLTFQVTNPGLIDVEDVEVTLIPDETTSTLLASGGIAGGLAGARLLPLFALPQGSRLAFAIDVPPGISFLVHAPILLGLDVPDVIGFRVRVTYVMEGFERVQEFRFSDRVRGSIGLRLLDVHEEDPGTGLQLVGTLVNVGSGTAFNPLLEPAKGSGYAARETVILEDLEPNDAVTFRLPVDRVDEEPRANATKPPLLALEWNDAYGTLDNATVAGEVERLEQVEESVLERARAFWPWLVLAGIALVFGLVAGLRKLHARRVSA